MWPVVILLVGVVLFYWFSFCLTVVVWLKACLLYTSDAADE